MSEPRTPARRLRTRRLALGAAISLALLAAACGSDDDGGSSSTTAGGDPAATTAAGATTTAASSDVDPDATFRFAYYVDVSRWDPHRTSTGQDLTWLAPVYDRLVLVSPTAEPIPGLATEWSFEENGTVLAMKLREGVTFSDGEPFDSAAVKANIERGKTLPDSTVATDLKVIDRVETPSPTEVRFVLSEPASTLPLVLSERAGMMVSPKAFDPATLDSKPVGTGPYTLERYAQGDGAVYVRNPDYWDPDAARVARMEFRVMKDSATRLNALLAGEIDAAQLDPVDRDAAEAAGLTIQIDQTTGFVKNQMNRTKAPFDDVRVRQAMNYATNRAAITEALTFGVAEPTNQPFPKGYFAYSESAAEAYPYDIEKAKSLLAEAGLENGFSFEAVVANTPIRVQAAEALQAQLKEIGVDMSIRTVEPAQASEVFFRNQEGETVVSAWSGRPDPLQTFAALYLPDQFTNPGGHTTEAVEAAFVAANDPSLTGDARAEKIRAVTDAVTEDALEWAIYQDFSIMASSDKVVGLVNYLSGKPEFRGVGIAL